MSIFLRTLSILTMLAFTKVASADNFTKIMPIERAGANFLIFDQPEIDDFKAAVNSNNCEEVMSILKNIDYPEAKHFLLSRLYQTGICVKQGYIKAIELLKKEDFRKRIIAWASLPCPH